MIRLLWILTMFVLWLVDLNVPVPYEKPRAVTDKERAWIDKAVRIDRIGRHTLIVGDQEIVIRLESGQTRRMKRGG